MIHDARIVPMDGRAARHGAAAGWAIRAAAGKAARWSSTRSDFTDKTAFRGSGEHLHLVERFTRVDAETPSNTDSPPRIRSTWTRPWTGMFPLKKTDGPIYEYACHEGNARSMVGMLRGARAEERAISR